MRARLAALAAAIVAAPAAGAASPAVEDSRARALRDLATVAAEEIRDFLASAPMRLPLPVLDASPPLEDPDARAWQRAISIHGADMIRTEGLGLEVPRHAVGLACSEGRIFGTVMIPAEEDGAGRMAASPRPRKLLELGGPRDRIELAIDRTGWIAMRAKGRAGPLAEAVAHRTGDGWIFCFALPAGAVPGAGTRPIRAVIPPAGFLKDPVRVDLVPARLSLACRGAAGPEPGEIVLGWKGADRPRRATLAVRLRNRGLFEGTFGEEAIGAREIEPGEDEARFRIGAIGEGLVGTVAGIEAGGETFTWVRVAYVPPARRTVASLKAAVLYLAEKFPDRYDGDRAIRRALAALEARAAALRGDARDGSARADLYADARALSRRALVEENPLLAFEALLFVRREAFRTSFYAYTEAVSWARNREWNFAPPAALCALRPPRPDGRVEVLVDAPKGVIRDPDVSWDASEILFSMKRDEGDDYHLYELELSGGEIRPLTRDAGFADYEGCYAPDGGIVFNSSRCVQTVPCWITPVSNLYRMDGDGRHIHRISFNQVHDNFPTVMDDGRIVYTRWEYNDRSQIWPQGLFVMNPDGTRATALYGNQSYWPVSMLHARAVPGTGRIICTLAGHHTWQFGEIGLFDPARGTDEAEGCLALWPPRPIEPIHEERYPWRLLERYAYPYPLSDAFFLVSCQPEGRSLFGIYLIDIFGNRERIHADPARSCQSPVPLRPRERPPVIPSRIDYAAREGTVLLLDVHRGPGLAGIPRGTVKALRVIELIFRPYGSPRGIFEQGPGGTCMIAPAVALGGTWDVKRVVGIVPVEPDGSAHFRVPARTALSFQPLDARGRALQWMRSWVTLMPGERVSCVGCHEPKGEAPPRVPALASRRPPVEPRPPWPGDRPFSFHEDVQPVLDRHCVRCHGADGPKGIDLRGDRTDAFSLAYEHLRPHVTCPGPQSVPTLLPPRATGAVASRLVEILDRGHGEVRLPEEAMARIVTWIDLNVPYYRSYALTRPSARFGRCTIPDWRPLRKALGPACARCHRFGFDEMSSRARFSRYDSSLAVLANLTHPAESRILRAPLAEEAGGLGLCPSGPFASTADPRYRAALAVIRGWAEDLARNPREDMPGAKPSEAYLVWWRKRQESERIEAASLRALAAGRPGGAGEARGSR